jgi:GNAT superfamily N-acetyltransferase
MEVCIAEKGSPLWNELITYAEGCSWRAGRELARLMREDAFMGFERVFAACEGSRIAGFCTLTEKDELPPGQPYSPFIGFIFVDEAFRGQRISEQLIKKAAGYACGAGFGKVYIMSGEVGLYEKYGFTKIGDFETIYGGTEQLFAAGAH